MADQRIGQIRVKNINAQRQLSKEVQVERLTVNSVDRKDAASDAMTEVNTSVGDQTATLGSKLDTLNKNIASIIENNKNNKNNNSDASGKDKLSDALTALRETIISSNQAPPMPADGAGSAGATPGQSRAETLIFATTAAWADAAVKQNAVMRDFTKEVDDANITLVDVFKKETAATG